MLTAPRTLPVHSYSTREQEGRAHTTFARDDASVADSGSYRECRPAKVLRTRACRVLTFKGTWGMDATCCTAQETSQRGMQRECESWRGRGGLGMHDVARTGAPCTIGGYLCKVSQQSRKQHSLNQSGNRQCGRRAWVWERNVLESAQGE